MTFLLFVILAQMVVIVWLSRQLRKARNNIIRTSQLIQSGEAIRGNRHVVDGPVVMRLHLKQDR